MSPSPTTIFDGEDTLVPEGTSHRYRCTLADEDGSPIQLAAITAIRGWLDNFATGLPINGRTDQDVRGANNGALTDAGGGVGRFTWSLTPDDAVIATVPPPLKERHRITLKFTYTKVGGGTGQLTKQVIYSVQSFARI